MNTPSNLIHHVEDPADVGARADVVLGRHLPGVSRRVARRMALAGKLDIDGRRGAPSERVELGQRLALLVPAEPAAVGTAEILRVTPSIVYVAKLPGVAVHRLGPDEAPALADMIAADYPECREVGDDLREFGALHRLDRPTSGVVAFARTREAWLAGRRGFTEGLIMKHYAAISTSAEPRGIESWLANPRPEEELALPPQLTPELRQCGIQPRELPTWRIRAALGHGEHRGLVTVRGDGMPATTILQVLAENGNLRFALLRLISGRRHQARAHLAAIGWPLLGDLRYGGEKASRLLLHAWSLDLSAVIDGESAVLDPLPAALRDALLPLDLAPPLAG